MLATYIASNKFSVDTDRREEFNTGRRVKLNCGIDGVFYATIILSELNGDYTEVTINEPVLTSNLSDVLYGVVTVGTSGGLPIHSHSNSEGHGGQISFIDLYDTPSIYENGKYLTSTASGIAFTSMDAVPQSLLELTDTPDNYDSGKYLCSTSSGTVWSEQTPASNWVLKYNFSYSNVAVNENISWDGETYGRIMIFWSGSGESSGSALAFTINEDSGSNYIYGALTQDGSTGAFSYNSATNISIGYTNRQVFSYFEGMLKNTGARRLFHKKVSQYNGDNTDSVLIEVSYIWNNSVNNVTSLQFSSGTTKYTGMLKIYAWQDITDEINTTFIGLTDTPSSYLNSEGMFAQSTGSGIVWAEAATTSSSYIEELIFFLGG